MQHPRSIWPLLSLAWLAVAAASFFTVLWWDAIALAVLLDIKWMAISGITAVLMYAHGVPENARLRLRTALIRGSTGMMSGLIAGHAAAGANLGAHLETVAAGLAGASGPDALKKVADKVVNKL